MPGGKIMPFLTWYGNATAKVSADGSELVFDPFITLNDRLPELAEKDFAVLKEYASPMAISIT